MERKRKRKLTRTASGRSIVEMLGVLAIMGVITVMGISGYSQAVGRLNRNKVQEDITRYAQEIRTLYAGRSIVVGDKVFNAVTGIMGITTMPAPYGGQYTITSKADGGFFGIHVPNIAATDCAYFSNIIWQGARTSEGASQDAGEEHAYFAAGSCPANGGTHATGTSKDCPDSNACMSIYYN
jgi:type II secretory pathway pseudopilin PulG